MRNLVGQRALDAILFNLHMALRPPAVTRGKGVRNVFMVLEDYVLLSALHLGTAL